VNLLLDTHAVLWSIYEPDQIPASLKSSLKRPDFTLYLSEASLWELLDKAAKGRLPLAGTHPEKILRRIREFGILSLSVTEADIMASVSLPEHHGDPFDRMLVAQAQRRGFTLVTRDRMLLLYEVPILWA
jgi:PIN domain nuclease of toxin-antitoxin system